MRGALALCVCLALVLAGCGESASAPVAPKAKSDRLVNLSAKPPLVNALEIDPETDEFMLTTNKGFFRIARETGKVTPVKGTITAGAKTDTVGTFLFMLRQSDGRLIGSGHPDSQDRLPSFLGFIESTDGGKSWTVLSRLGEADLHKIIERDGKLFAFDAVLGAMLVSDDGGKTFTEKFTPRGLIIDFEIDPDDDKIMFAATERELFKTENGGESWRPSDRREGIRLSWPAPDAFYRATRDGTVERSSDRGSTWERVGSVPGEPYKFKALDADHLFLALSDGTIMETTDGGKTWKAAFTP